LDPGFVCDHLLGELYRAAVQSITDESRRVASPLVGMTPWAQRRVEERIRQMPRMIQVAPTDSHGITVAWTDGESQSLVQLRGRESYFRVTLHDWKACAAKADTLLYDHAPAAAEVNGGHPSVTACTCPSQLVSQDRSRVEFPYLDPAKMYFPMIAREAHHSFLGTTASPIRPHAGGSLGTSAREPREPTITDAILAQYGAYRESESWQEWQAAHLQDSFDQLRPPGYREETPTHDFERIEHHGALRVGTYVEISLSDLHPTLPPILSVLFVHELRVPRPSSQFHIAPTLVATRFSYLHESPAFAPATDLSPCELLLHFRDYDRMGQLDDAETFALGPSWSNSRSPGPGRVVSSMIYVSSLLGDSVGKNALPPADSTLTSNCSSLGPRPALLSVCHPSADGLVIGLYPTRGRTSAATASHLAASGPHRGPGGLGSLARRCGPVRGLPAGGLPDPRRDRL
jgi:hypothetical protein